MKLSNKYSIIMAIALSISLVSCTGNTNTNDKNTSVVQEQSLVTEDTHNTSSGTQSNISDPEIIITNGNEEIKLSNYNGSPYIEVNDNTPFFSDKEKITDEFETYSELDSLGRCGVAYANISTYTLPTDERGSIGSVKPSGWHSVRYDIVDGKYLYNRCHLIGYQLAAENANPKNLITGTRYLNIDGMLDHENLVANYVKDTGNHVLYRVTPIYYKDNLVATGILIEGYSVEDNGAGIQFNIFAYNSQPGITIDYSTGDSWLTETGKPGMTIDNLDEDTEQTEEKEYTENKDGIVYYINTDSKKYHLSTCRYANENMEKFNGTIEWLNDNGYEPCKVCKPDKK